MISPRRLGLAGQWLWRSSRLVAGMVLGRPAQCLVQVTERCNLRCGFCGFWCHPSDPAAEMTVADYERLSEKLAAAGSLIVSIEGGEPLLRDDIAGVVRALVRHHHPLLFTNGLLVTDEKARALWAAGLGSAGVSIDYPDAARHDAHRGAPGVFARAVRAVEILRDTAPRGGRQVSLMTVVMDDNAADLDRLLDLSARLGVRHEVTLISTTGDRRGKLAQRLPPRGTGARLLGLKRRHPQLSTLSGYLAGIDRFLDGELAPGCHAGRRLFDIDAVGDVFPCVERLDERAGNVLRDPWPAIADRLAAMDGPRRCAACYTECRGFIDEMTGRPRARAWREFLTSSANPAIPL